MKKVIATMILTAMISPLQAKIMTCIGMDPTMKTLKVIVDTKANKMIVNGDLFDTYNDHIAWDNNEVDTINTNKFITKNGIYVFDTLGLSTKKEFLNSWFLIQINAATRKSISYAMLSCTIDEN